MTSVIACDGRMVTLAQPQSAFNKSQSDPAVTSILLLNYPEGHGQNVGELEIGNYRERATSGSARSKILYTQTHTHNTT